MSGESGPGVRVQDLRKHHVNNKKRHPETGAETGLEVSSVDGTFRTGTRSGVEGPPPEDGLA